MTRVALVPSEPLRPAMAGIGIRYLELARRLPSADVEIVLVTAGEPADVPDCGLQPSNIRHFERGALKRVLSDCDAVITQGQLANDVVLELPDKPTAIDFYDPFLIENFAYVASLGLDPYRNDHATWMLQLSRGDFFLCSSEEQRLFYLGLLTALGRVNPRAIEDDADLRRLIAPVPFGVPDVLPPHQPLLPTAEPGERRLLFGGLYDWYDPWPVLEALEAHGQQDDAEHWTLLFIRNPNPGTPQTLFAQVESWCRQRGLWDESTEDGPGAIRRDRVQILDWVPGERRFDLLRDVDLMIATHRATLETRLSLRTRFLEALAAACPVVTTEGGAISRLLRQHAAGWVVPESDAEAVLQALTEALIEPSESGCETRQAKAEGARRLCQAYAWRSVLEPLAEFCRHPFKDVSAQGFVAPRPTHAPADSLAFRLRRKFRRMAGIGP